jgi:hypothetical protein
MFYLLSIKERDFSMNTLIINRLTTFPYREWLKDVDNVVMISQVERPDFFSYTHFDLNENFDKNGKLEMLAIELHKQYNFSSIIAVSELDLIRAARLREFLGIEGQSVESAIAYRNKAVMKKLVKNFGGVEVDPFQEVNSSIDIYEFIDINGFPVVIKPVDGGGSINTTVVHNREELKDYLSNCLPENLIIEKFIEGDMYHVDGIFVNNEVMFSSVSRYINGCLAFQHGDSLGSVVINKNSNLSERLNENLISVLRALPGSNIIAFHAEFFHTKEDRIIFCEIASRIGGARVNDTIEKVYGINLVKTWIRIQNGLEIQVNNAPNPQLGGWLIIPPIEGLIVDLPASVPFDWVVDYKPMVQKGQSIKMAKTSIDNIASMIVEGDSEDIIESRLKELDQWYRSSVKIKQVDLDILR